MATFTETKINVQISVVRTQSGDKVILEVQTEDAAAGVAIRNFRRDVTALMSAARMAGVTALLDDAVSYTRQQLSLPADVVVGEPQP